MSQEIHLPKAHSHDFEWGHILEGGNGEPCRQGGTILLDEFPGLPVDAKTASPGARGVLASAIVPSGAFRLFTVGPGECGLYRRFRPENGASFYLDHDHFEACGPETLSPRENIAAFHGMLRLTREAQARVNAKLPPGMHLHVFARCTDGFGHSWGPHNNYLMGRPGFDAIMHKAHVKRWVASYMAGASTVVCGAGKVGAENGRQPCAYQTSQRGDFFSRLESLDTTGRNRGIINTRDEPLGNRGARFHVILYDPNLLPVAHLHRHALAVLLTMVEAGEIDPRLTLANPVVALEAFRDPHLRAGARLAVGGQIVTAVESQMLFLELMMRFVDAGRCDGLVPEARESLALLGDTLTKLHRKDYAALTGRLDWVLKWSLLVAAREADPSLTWESPRMRALDHTYGDLEDGLFFQCLEAGLVERAVTEAEIQRSNNQPVTNTRAAYRSLLLRLAPPEAVAHVSWNAIVLRIPAVDGGMPILHTVRLDDPLACPRPDDPIHQAKTLEEALSILGQPIPRPATPANLN